MADSINIFLSLLRSGLYGTPIPKSELPDSIDWEAVIRLAQKHVVFGIVIESIQFLPARLRPAGAIAAKVNKFALSLIQANIIMDRSAARLVRFLNSHDISGVLLKGEGVARYYRLPQMRQSGDIDFYVGHKAYKRASELCREHLSADKKGGESDYHFGFYLANGIHVELHRLASRVFTPVRNRRFQEWSREELEKSPRRRTLTIENTDITLPSYDFDAIFIFYHAWRHYIMGGIGLRQLCDWTTILYTHAADIDTGRLEENLKRFGMIKGWKLFGCIAVSHLGLPAEKMPLYDPTYHKKSEKVFEEIMKGGNFGYYSEAYLRTRGLGYSGVRYSWNKLRNYTSYFLSLFPLLPLEAIFLFANRLVFGPLDILKRRTNK